MKRTKVRALSSRSSPDKVEDRIRVRVKVKVKVKAKDRAKVRAKAMSNGVATPEVNSRMKVKTKRENKRNVNSNSSQRKIRELFVLKPNNNWYVIFSVYGLLSYREWLIKPPGYS